MPYLMFLAICAIWAASFILMKKAVLAFDPLTVGAGRVIGGAAILGLIWLIRGEKWSLKRSHLPSFCIILLLGFTWPYCIQPYLVSVNGSVFVAMTVSFNPLFTILASIVLLDVRPTSRQLWGVLGALVFLLLLLSEGMRQTVTPVHALLCLSVPLGYAVSNVLIRRDMKDIPPIDLTFFAQGIASLILGPLAIAFPFTTPPQPETWVQGFLCIALLGTVGTGLAMYWFNILIRDHGPLFAGMVTNLVPLGAVMWGWADKETITPLQLISLVGILLMVWMVQYKGASLKESVTEIALLRQAQDVQSQRAASRTDT